MTTYPEESATKLTSAAESANGAELSVLRINGAKVSHWPHVVRLPIGTVSIARDGTVTYDDAGDGSRHPRAGDAVANGSLTFTLWNGVEESPTYTCNLTLFGAPDHAGDTTPALTDPVARTAGSGAFTASVFSNRDSGVLYFAATTNAAPPSVAQIKTGRDSTGELAEASGSIPAAGGILRVSGSGLSEERNFHTFFYLEDGDEVGSDIVAAAAFSSGPADDDPPADATVSSAGELNAVIRSWQKDWNGTAGKIGKPPSAARYVDCTRGSYDRFAKSRYRFPQKVHVRSADRAGGAVFAAIALDDCSNIAFKYLSINGNCLFRNGASNIDLEHCALSGAKPGAPLGRFYGVQIDGNQGKSPVDILVSCCSVERYGKKGILVRRAANITLRNNVFNEAGDDDIHIKDISDSVIEGNWGTFLHRNRPQSHMDFIQGASYPPKGGAGGTFVTIRGNVCYDGAFPNRGKKPFRQGIFLSDAPFNNTVVEDNVIVAANPNGILVRGNNVIIQNNTVLYLNDAGNRSDRTGIRHFGSGFTAARNIVRSGKAVGRGSIAITRAQYPNYYCGLRRPGDRWKFIGIGGDFSELMPQPRQVSHWLSTTPVGAFYRLEEIFSKGRHPGNDGWPTARLWNATYNRHRRITS